MPFRSSSSRPDAHRRAAEKILQQAETMAAGETVTTPTITPTESMVALRERIATQVSWGETSCVRWETLFGALSGTVSPDTTQTDRGRLVQLAAEELAAHAGASVEWDRKRKTFTFRPA